MPLSISARASVSNSSASPSARPVSRVSVWYAMNVVIVLPRTSSETDVVAGELDLGAIPLGGRLKIFPERPVVRAPAVRSGDAQMRAATGRSP
jgi:hypothetical protein